MHSSLIKPSLNIAQLFLCSSSPSLGGFFFPGPHVRTICFASLLFLAAVCYWLILSPKQNQELPSGEGRKARQGGFNPVVSPGSRGRGWILAWTRSIIWDTALISNSFPAPTSPDVKILLISIICLTFRIFLFHFFLFFSGFPKSGSSDTQKWIHEV